MERRPAADVRAAGPVLPSRGVSRSLSTIAIPLCVLSILGAVILWPAAADAEQAPTPQQGAAAPQQDTDTSQRGTAPGQGAAPGTMGATAEPPHTIEGAPPARPGGGQPAPAPAANTPAAAETSAASAAPADLVFENADIITFRATFAGLSPADRARTALHRLEGLDRETMQDPVRIENISGGSVLRVGEQLAFAVVEGDIDPRTPETPARLAERARARLQNALKTRATMYTTPVVIKSIAVALFATAVCVALIILVVRLRRGALARLRGDTVWIRRHFSVAGFDPSPHIAGALRLIVQVGTVLLVLAFINTWATVLLNDFPQTQYLGRPVRDFFVGVIGHIGRGIIRAVPGLVTIGVILAVTRLATNVLTDLCRGIERGEVRLPGLHQETIGATRRLVNAALWLFALVIIYPYLPGSDSDAFKGVSVMVGLVVTLGSSGIVGHLMSGLVLVYARALRKGDYVRVGEVEGIVLEVGGLATKIVTPKNEEFTVPNTVMVGSNIKNWTRMAKEGGVSVSTAVTIGYDAPWRQVHALLQGAAARTEGLRREPPPFVLQRSLSDFYVEYELVARLEGPERRAFVLSALHQNIQDAFNEQGVQIMSPHFVGQPERPVIVPKARWHADPARED
jgi:small-conductance mechanosensitive channel